jgi:hypothetical protein
MTKRSGVWIVAVAAACGGAPRGSAPPVGNEPIGNTVAMDKDSFAIDPEYADAYPLEEGRAPRGPLDKTAIRAVVHMNHNAIRKCYTVRLLDDPKLAGTTTATFTIAPDGKVSAVQASGFDGAVDACIAGVIKNEMSFPQPPENGAVDVSYPFEFKLADAPPADVPPEP